MNITLLVGVAGDQFFEEECEYMVESNPYNIIVNWDYYVKTFFNRRKNIDQVDTDIIRESFLDSIKEVEYNGFNMIVRGFYPTAKELNEFNLHDQFRVKIYAPESLDVIIAERNHEYLPSEIVKSYKRYSDFIKKQYFVEFIKSNTKSELKVRKQSFESI